MSLTKKEFLRRVTENTETYHYELSTGSFNVMNYHGYDFIKGELSRTELSKKIHDLYGSLILGCLFISRDLTGADAIRYCRSTKKLVPIEIKTSYVDRRKIWRSDLGTLYVGSENTKNKRSRVMSNITATFDIMNNLDSKNRETYLIALDNFNDTVIEIMKMDGDTVIDLLSNKKDGDRVVERTSKKRSIMLSTFKKHGKPATGAVPAKGIENWFEELRSEVPVVLPGQKFSEFNFLGGK